MNDWMRLSLCLAILVALSACGGTNPRPTSGDQVPYDITSRPMPSGDDLEVLLPRTVGSFTRGEIEGTDFRSADVYATYTSNRDSVFMGFSIPGEAADAQSALEIAQGEAGDGLYVTGQETSYFKSDSFMAWTRGGYFFFADASSSAALDAFMASFPY